MTPPEQLNPNPSYSCITEGTPISPFDLHMSNWCCVFREPFITQSMNVEFQMPFCYSNGYFGCHQIGIKIEEKKNLTIEKPHCDIQYNFGRQHAEVPKIEEKYVVSELKENKYVFTDSWK